jgi:hypothetical protein
MQIADADPPGRKWINTAGLLMIRSTTTSKIIIAIAKYKKAFSVVLKLFIRLNSHIKVNIKTRFCSERKNANVGR